MRNDIAKLMKTAAATVATRIQAHPSEVLACMKAEWAKGGSAERQRMTEYMKQQTA